MKKLLIIIISVFFTSQTMLAKTDLKFNLDVGQDYHLIINTKSVISQVLNGKDNDMLLSLKFSMTYDVKDKKDNIYTMEVFYDSLSMGVSSQGYDVTYNSESPKDTNDYVSILLAALRNNKFSVKMTDRGKVVGISNLESLFDVAFKNIQKLDPLLRKQLESNLKSSFGEESFKANFETITAIFPKEPVDKGSQWETESILESNMPIKVNTLFKYEKENKDNYVISGLGKLVSYQPKVKSSENSTPYSYHFTGTIDSEIKLDKKTCWIKEARFKQAMNGYSLLKSDVGTANPEKIKMGIKVITTYND